MVHNIAMDGPAGAGKSTVAKLVAKELNYIYVDTGAMYRTIALYMQRNNVDLRDREAVEGRCADVSIRLENSPAGQRIFLSDEDVSEAIREESVGMGASIVSAYDAVRARLTSMQKEIAAAQSVVMDGRDIGTVVLPDAITKVFITASVEERAKRRFKELVAKGENPDISLIEKDIAQRDRQDMERPIAPLKPAPGCHMLDTTDMTIDEAVSAILDIHNENMRQATNGQKWMLASKFLSI